MRNIGITLLLLFGIYACSEAQQIKRLSGKDFKNLMEKTPNKIVLDVRTNGEVAQGVIAQAIQIDYSNPNFDKQLDRLDKNKPVFIYCAVGGRSRGASTILAKKGFKQIYDLEGGINTWQSLGFPTAKITK
jgi:phage shock protein E